MARGFAAVGAEVVATGSSQTKVEAAGRDSANAGISLHHVDVRRRAQVDLFFGGIARLDVLVNAAGIVKCGFRLKPAIDSETKPATVPI